MQNTDNVINLKEIKRKKIFEESGLDTNKLLLCFNGEQFMEIIKQLFVSGKNATEVLTENRNLYKIGYFDEESNQIHVYQ